MHTTYVVDKSERFTIKVFQLNKMRVSNLPEMVLRTRNETALCLYLKIKEFIRITSIRRIRSANLRMKTTRFYDMMKSVHNLNDSFKNYHWVCTHAGI